MNEAKPKKISAFLRYVFMYGILPNLIFWVASHWVYMMRPAFNLDYVLIGAAASFLPAVVTLPILAVTFINDVLVNAAPLYHFQIVEVFRTLREITYIDWTYSLPLFLGLMLVTFTLSWAVVRFGKVRENRLAYSSGILILGFLIAVTDIANGTSFLPLHVQKSLIDFNVAYSGIRRTVMSLKTLNQLTDIKYAPLQEDEAATGQLFQSVKNGPTSALPKNVVVVVVESMGLFKDPGLREALVSPFATEALKQKYDFKTTETKYQGHTIDGEFRELCNIRLVSYGEKNIPKCLPAYFKERGYATLGIHGFTNQFYNRYRWYPLLGFDKSLFAQDFRQMGFTHTCGSGFTGMCDTEMADFIHQELKKDPAKPKFIYWMTLNSHLPLDEISMKDSKFDCNASSIIKDGGHGVCMHSRMIHLVIESLAKIAEDPEIQNTEFIVVGDHTAPFLSSDQRFLYSDIKVPSLTLSPRVTEGVPSNLANQHEKHASTQD